jgi:hypothetical protein
VCGRVEHRAARRRHLQQLQVQLHARAVHSRDAAGMNE